MTSRELNPSRTDRSFKQEAIAYYARPENEGLLTNLHDFFGRYVDHSERAPTKLIDGVEHEFPELLCLGVDNQHRLYVLRTTQQMIPQTFDSQEFHGLGFILAEFDPRDKASEYTVAPPLFGQLENTTPGMNRLTLAIDAQQYDEVSMVTKSAHLYLTSQGIYKVMDGEYISLDSALHLPSLIEHERTGFLPS